MRYTPSRWLLPPVLAAFISTSAAYGQERNHEPLEAPPVSLDVFAGRTVKDRKAGYGIVKARAKNLPNVRTTAPDFDLKTADGNGSIKLSSFRGKQPVVLIFGSVT